jgi:hypothetical protein
MSYYIAEVIEDDDGELVLELPVQVIDQMGWDEHTLLQWVIEEENVYLTEKNKDSTEGK